MGYDGGASPVVSRSLVCFHSPSTPPSLAMACFSAPLAEAVVVSLAKSAAKKDSASPSTNPFVARLGWLQRMLFGGSFLLAIEHVWHGEIIPQFPFLTAVRDGEVAGMLREIATVGVAMAVLITTVWAVMVCIATALSKKGAAPCANS